MSRDPAQRQHSALEFAQHLRHVQQELGLPPTPLEVADDEWAAAASGIDFADDRARGPVRASVAYESKRPARGSLHVSRSPEDTMSGASEPRAGASRTRAIVLLVGAGIAIAAIAATIAILLVSAGR